MSGDASILRLALATGALILSPLIGAIALGGLQHAGYRLFRAQPPMFPVLLLRGLMVMIAGIAAMVFFLKFGLGQSTMGPSAG